ncbi:hypothetical protein [Streptosporangium sp. NPDC000509]
MMLRISVPLDLIGARPRQSTASARIRADAGLPARVDRDWRSARAF